MQLSGVVLAAGEGRRLRPLTEHWPKPVLPIDGRSVIATLLRELRAAGLSEVTVVVGHLAEQVERLLGDGSGFGLSIRYANSRLRTAPRMLCGALWRRVRSRLSSWQEPTPSSAAETSERRLRSGRRPARPAAWASVPYRPGSSRAAPRCEPLGDASSRLAVRSTTVRERESSLPHRSGFSTIVSWAGSRRLPGPPYELAEAGRRLLGAGETILALELGPTRDLTHPEDVARHNYPYLG